jgi:anti-anti-sigma factor
MEGLASDFDFLLNFNTAYPISGCYHCGLLERYPMAGGSTFRYEVEKSPTPDSQGNKVTTITCHGRLVNENAGEVKEVVRPLLPLGGRIVIDLSDVSYLDSSGLGTLVGLKASALKQGLCILQYVNMTPRVLELMRLTNLSHLFSS